GSAPAGQEGGRERGAPGGVDAQGGDRGGPQGRRPRTGRARALDELPRARRELSTAGRGPEGRGRDAEVGAREVGAEADGSSLAGRAPDRARAAGAGGPQGR